MGTANLYGTVLLLASFIGVLAIVGDDVANWQIISMLSAGMVMTLVALTFDRFDIAGEGNNGFIRQMQLYLDHLFDDMSNPLEDFRPGDRIAACKVPVVFYLPCGLVMFVGGLVIESLGWAPNGWNLDDYLYWIKATLTAITSCLLYAFITTPLRRWRSTRTDASKWRSDGS